MAIDVNGKEPHIKPENADVGGRVSFLPNTIMAFDKFLIFAPLQNAAIDVDESPHVKPESSRGVKRQRSGTMETGAASLARYKERKLRNGRIEIDLTDD